MIIVAMRLSFRFAAVLVLSTVIRAAAQTSAERLLPDSYIKSVQLKWMQDGRVVDLEVETPQGEFVIIQIDMLAYYRRCNTLLANLGGYDPACPTSPESRRLKVELQPRTKSLLHLEVMSKEEIVKVEIDSARGRQMTSFEQLKARFR